MTDKCQDCGVEIEQKPFRHFSGCLLERTMEVATRYDHTPLRCLLRQLAQKDARIAELEADARAHKVSNYALKASCEIWKEENERLKAGQLFTADGVAIVHGMRVWPPFVIEDEQGGLVKFCVYDDASGELHIEGDGLNIRKCFSTAEAQAALEGRE